MVERLHKRKSTFEQLLRELNVNTWLFSENGLEGTFLFSVFFCFFQFSFNLENMGKPITICKFSITILNLSYNRLKFYLWKSMTGLLIVLNASLSYRFNESILFKISRTFFFYWSFQVDSIWANSSTSVITQL